MPYSHYRTRIYYRHFRRLGMTALRAWKLSTLNAR